MVNLTDFNSEHIDPINMDNAPVDRGIYPGKMISGERAATKNNTGEMLKCVFELTAKDVSGKKVFHNFNIVNASETAVKIGRGMLKSLSLAVGLKDIPNELEDVFEKECLLKIDIEESVGYSPRNTIKAFYPLDEDKSAKPKQEAAGAIPAKTEAVVDDLPDFLK